MREVGEQLLVLVEDLRADGDAQDCVLPRRPVLQSAASIAATFGLDVLVRPEPRQLAQVRVRHEHDVAAGAAVAAVGAALRDVLLPPERKPPVTAPAGLHVDAGAVVEHRRYSPSTMEIVRRSPLERNETRPSRVAKIVSSRPIPAPAPGLNFVPRCRARIIPALTSWPSKSLTPSRFDWESRPFFEEPRPFLCAITRSPSLRAPTRALRSRPCAGRARSRTRAPRLPSPLPRSGRRNPSAAPSEQPPPSRPASARPSRPASARPSAPRRAE